MKTVKANKVGLLFFALSITIISIFSTVSAQTFFIDPSLLQPKYDVYNPILTTPLIDITIPNIQVQITSPATDSGINDSEFAYDGYDDSKGMWYTDVIMSGWAVDGDASNPITGSNLVWKTNRSDVQNAALGLGHTVRMRLYSNSCFGSDHVITLSATNDAGYTVSTSRRINIWTLC